MIKYLPLDSVLLDSAKVAWLMEWSIIELIQPDLVNEPTGLYSKINVEKQEKLKVV